MAHTTLQTTVLGTSPLNPCKAFGKKGGHLPGNATALPPQLFLLGQQVGHGSAIGHYMWVWVGDRLSTRVASDILPNFAYDVCGAWQRAWLENIVQSLTAWAGAFILLRESHAIKCGAVGTGLALRHARRGAGAFILLLESHGLVCHPVG